MYWGTWSVVGLERLGKGAEGITVNQVNKRLTRPNNWQIEEGAELNKTLTKKEQCRLGRCKRIPRDIDGEGCAGRGVGRGEEGRQSDYAMWHTVHFSANSIIAYWHQFASCKAEECRCGVRGIKWAGSAWWGVAERKLTRFTMRDTKSVESLEGCGGVHVECNWHFLWFGREHLRLPNAQQRVHTPRLAGANNKSTIHIPPHIPICIYPVIGTSLVVNNSKVLEWPLFSFPFPCSFSPVCIYPFVLLSSPLSLPHPCRSEHWQVLSFNCICCDLLVPSRHAGHRFVSHGKA